jgi:general secretion pathway protein D
MHIRLLRKLTELMFVLLIAGTATLFAMSPKHMYQQGEKAEASGDLDGAFTAYVAASRAQPNEIQYRQAMEKLRFTAAEAHVHLGEHQLEVGNTTEALREFLRALDIDPGSAVARQDLQKAQDLVKAKDSETNPPLTATGGYDKPAAPPRLELASHGLLTMQMVEQSTALYQALGRVAGINVLIDPDYHAVRVALDVKGVTVLEALHILNDLSNSFWKPVSRNTIFVAANTSAKRKILQVQAMQIFYLSNVAQQSDLNDVQTALRNILTGAKIYAVPSQNAIVLKGTADEILLAKTMIHALDRTRPEVLVDVYVLQVKRDKERKLGISPPTSLTVSSSSSSTLNSIGSTSSYSYSMGNAAADLLLSDSTTRMLQNPRIRALDGQKAVLKIGERIPTATGTYTSGTTAASTTSFQYIDVGVNMELTPMIHENRDVTLKLSMEVSSQSGTVTISSVEEPEIAQQKVDQVIRLREGEVSILAGLVDKEVTGAVSGWPGLGEIAAAKYLFSTQDHEKVDNEVIFMLVPHIVRAQEIDPLGGQSIGTGSGDVIELQMEGAHVSKSD